MPYLNYTLQFSIKYECIFFYCLVCWCSSYFTFLLCSTLRLFLFFTNQIHFVCLQNFQFYFLVYNWIYLFMVDSTNLMWFILGIASLLFQKENFLSKWPSRYTFFSILNDGTEWAYRKIFRRRIYCPMCIQYVTPMFNTHLSISKICITFKNVRFNIVGWYSGKKN